MANPNAQIEITAVDKTVQAFNAVQANFSKLENAGSTLNNVLGRLAPLIGAATFTSLVSNAVNAADAMNDLSIKTGIAVEQLGAWDLVARQNGTSLESIAIGLRNTSKYMVEHADNLEQIGIKGKTAEEVMVQLADKIAALPEDDPRRVALAMEVLGKSGQELLPVLAQGSESLKEWLATGRELNPVTDEFAKRADQLNDNLEVLRKQGEAISFSFAEAVAPSLIQITERMNEAAKSGGVLKSIFVGLGETLYQGIFGPDLEVSEAISAEQHAKNIARRIAREKSGADEITKILAQGGRDNVAAREKTFLEMLDRDEQYAIRAGEIMQRYSNYSLEVQREALAQLTENFYPGTLAAIEKHNQAILEKQRDLREALIADIFDAEAKRQLSEQDYEKLQIFKQYEEKLKIAENNAELIEALNYDTNQKLMALDQRYTEEYVKNAELRAEAGTVAVQQVEAAMTSSRSFMERFNAGRSAESLSQDARIFSGDNGLGLFTDVQGNPISAPIVDFMAGGRVIPDDVRGPAKGRAPGGTINFNISGANADEVVGRIRGLLRSDPSLFDMGVRAG